ncbi:sialate O-acetylesterase [uncultured Tateyamaria sp.]|uniref:sialate O-acetylesterase n=1 Tax=uncultured Tateyamaria sp. TaxID=455651 RepID=UPI0026353929|nr:sialate O-acetylesterase [uncultured Tateyamaria sp.]
MLSISLALGGLNPDAGSIEAPDPVSEVVLTPGGVLEVLSNLDPVEITVSAPADYAGTYSVTQAALAAGPVNLVPARLDAVPAIGQPIGHMPGLWVFDAALPAAVITVQWQRDGVDIAGETAPSYVLTSGDLGTSLSLRETATQAGGGTQVQASDAVGIVSRTRVLALMGQSNMVGFAPFDGGAAYPGGVLQVARSGRASGGNSGDIVAAQTLLDHYDGDPSFMGPALQFAIDYAAAHPNDTLLLVPDAKGATGLAAGQWTKGGFYYDTAVARVNAVLADNPTFEFCGILWHQGESDAGSAGDAAAYATRLDTMIADMRTDITGADADTPFIAGGMVPDWVAADANRQTVQAALSDTPNRVSRAGFADSAGLSPLPDGIHFDAAALRSLGSRYFTAFNVLDDASSPPVDPDPAWDIDGTVIQSALTPAAPSVAGTVVLEGI